MAKLIVIGGSLATGKSTLARELEARTGIKLVSMDELKARLFDVGGYRDRTWSKRIGRMAWPIFQEMVEMHLEMGESVIAEATFCWPDDQAWLLGLQERYGCELVQIWMTCDPRVARERFIARAHDHHPGHGDALESVLEEFDQRFFYHSFIPHPHISKTKIVDTTDIDSVDSDEILEWISV